MAAGIDSHHHFWRYRADEFGWIDDSMDCIRRDFLPDDLEACLRETGMDGVLTVQARQTLEETRWLLDLAEKHDFIKGVVGWIPLTATDLGGILEELGRSDKLRAVREICQGQPPGFMLRSEFLAGIELLAGFGLVYDILIQERQLEETIRLVDHFPGQTFVLDHAAKPRIRDAVISDWARNMDALSRRTNVFCKISGLVTEADREGWTTAHLRPYFEVLLETFGPDRLMFGSDWPVCLAACGYGRWHATVEQLATSLSPDETADIFGNTALRAYRISITEAPQFGLR